MSIESRGGVIVGGTGGSGGSSDTSMHTRVGFTTTTDTGTLGTAEVYACTDTSAARILTISTATIALGSPTSVKYITVKDESGGASSFNITVDTESGTINGGASTLISVDYGVVNLYVDGTNVWGK